MKYKKYNWKKQLAYFLLAAVLMASLVPNTFYAAPDTENEESENIVFPEDTICVSSAEDLLTLAENCIDDDWSVGKTVVLQNDIDLTGVKFYGIPTFGGTFYGQGHTISGYVAKHEGSVVGFFRYIQTKAVVDDLHIEGKVLPDGSSTIVGTIAGSNSGTIKNCSFTGSASGKEIIGGIVGLNQGAAMVENCIVNGKVYGNHYIGGIAGENKGVIRQCTNNAEINAEVDHNSLGISLELDLSNLIEKESVDTATNIGGIAGTSTGVIRKCVNRSNVGYQKMGYNVGGIVGSQNGYVVDCTNYGKVEGSDGVGGIAGQFKPNIVLEFGPDPMETMQNKMNSMMNTMKNSMKEMTNSISELELGLSDGSMDMTEEMNRIKESLESLENLKDPETGEFDQDMLDSMMNDFSNSFDEIYQESEELTNMTESWDISSKMDEMMSEMESMMSSIGSMNMSTEINIQDISRFDKETDTVGKISSCTNYGEVSGQNGVAGIAGNCDSEMMMSEDDMATIGEESVSIEGSVRLVLRDCINFGKVSANKAYVGGIAGQMVQGAVLNCYNVGNIDALNANYVGGIAGNCDTYIADCISKNIIAGGDYVGGIAGRGTEVYDNYAFVNLAAGTEYVGSIVGAVDELSTVGDFVKNNHYYHVGKDYGGIDGINYKDVTARITLEEFLALEEIPGMFKGVTIRFLNGEQETSMAVNLGENLALEEVPVLAVEDDEMYSWVYQKPVTSETLGMNETEEVLYLSEERLTGILFNQTYEADFEAKNMVSESDMKTEDNRSMILAVGAFDKDTSVMLTDMISSESTILDVTVTEHWSVDISNSGVEKLHYRIPQGMEADKMQLFVHSKAGIWGERAYVVEGSYIIFEFTDDDTAFAIASVEKADDTVVVVVGVVVVVLLLIFGSRKRKSKIKAE